MGLVGFWLVHALKPSANVLHAATIAIVFSFGIDFS